MRIRSGRGFLSTLVAILLWRLLSYSQNRLVSSGLPRLLCLPSDFLGRHIICNGAFERESMEFVSNFLASFPDDFCAKSAFLDIGANIGNHTCFFAPKFRLTVAVEPSEVVSSILRSNVLLNHLEAKVVVLEAAISDYSGVVKHYTSTGDNLGGSSLSDDRRDTVSSIGKEVSVLTGDEAVSDLIPYGVAVGFVKIDVEGHEYPVIRGLSSVLERDQPLVLFEIDSGPSGAACIQHLRDLGYEHFAEVIGDADGGRSSVVRLLRRFVYGDKCIAVHEIRSLESRYYESVLAVPARFAYLISKVVGGQDVFCSAITRGSPRSG